MRTDPSILIPIARASAVHSQRPFTWAVLHDDGSTIAEHDADGADHGFAEVQQAQAHTLLVHPVGAPSPLPLHWVHRTQVSERLIFFWRTKVTVDPNTDTVLARHVLTVFGLQSTQEGRNHAVYTFMFEDGTCLLSANREAIP